MNFLKSIVELSITATKKTIKVLKNVVFYLNGIINILVFLLQKKLYKFESTLNHMESLEDLRDYIFSKTVSISGNTIVDLRDKFKPAYNQLSIGSCASNATCAVYEYITNTRLKKDYMPSRLGLYYDARVLAGWPDKDNGSYIRDNFKVAAKQGLYSEILWPYVVKNVFFKPSARCYKEANKHQAIVYEKVPQKLESICAALNADLPIVFGFKVYSNFMSIKTASSGILNMPGIKDIYKGRHAVVLVGYDLEKKIFIVRNSWGSNWGQKGYFTMPFDYVLSNSLSFDFWLMRKVEG
jgi:C1A family cysteine protease